MSQWKCPVCGVKDVPYGKLTCAGKPECGNDAHVTGRHYINENGEVVRSKKKVQSTGIAQISNEDE